MSTYSIDYFLTLGRNSKSTDYCEQCEVISSKDENSSTSVSNVNCSPSLLDHESYEILCDLKFQAIVISKYPELDHSNISSPERSLSQFVFPSGLSFKYSKHQRFPIPSFFTFVFTDEKGNYFYVACLQFYEIVTKNEIQKILENVRNKINKVCTHR